MVFHYIHSFICFMVKFMLMHYRLVFYCFNILLFINSVNEHEFIITIMIIVLFSLLCNTLLH